MKTYDTKPRRVSAAQMERLANWSLRKPVIALMGEFSAGKSTLLNLLLGENVLPTQVTATRMPPVWLRYGNDAPYRVDRNGMQHPVNMKDPATFPLKDTRFIRVHVQSPMLRNCDLMDTPGISDPNIPTDSWIRAIGYANAVLWCTHAGQAWRESERSAWEALPMRLRRTSLLLITRSDKIVNAVDRDKIDRRMQRETAQLFDGRHFVSLTNAKTARDAGDDAGWQASGAAGFMDSLTRIIEGVGIERSYLVSRYQVSDGASTESFVNAAREAKAEAAAALAAAAPPAEEQVDFAEAIARAAAEKDPPVVSLRSALRSEAEDLVREEPEQVERTDDQAEDEPDVDVAEENEESAAPVVSLRRVRPETEAARERPSRSEFDDRIAQINQLAAASALGAPQDDEAAEPEDGEAVSALRDAFGAEDDAVPFVEDVASEIDVEQADQAGDVEPAFADAEDAADDELAAQDTVMDEQTSEEWDEPEDETAQVVDADDASNDMVEAPAVDMDDSAEAVESETVAAEDEVYVAEVEPSPEPVPMAASKGDSIDDLVSILSAAVPGAHKSAPVRDIAPVAAGSMGIAITQEAPAIRETWADMQSRYNIAAMPRLARMMDALLQELAVDESQMPVPAVEDRQLSVVTEAADDEAATEEPARAERRFVRGLF